MDTVQTDPSISAFAAQLEIDVSHLRRVIRQKCPSVKPYKNPANKREKLLTPLDRAEICAALGREIPGQYRDNTAHDTAHPAEIVPVSEATQVLTPIDVSFAEPVVTSGEFATELDAANLQMVEAGGVNLNHQLSAYSSNLGGLRRTFRNMAFNAVMSGHQQGVTDAMTAVNIAAAGAAEGKV